MKGFEADIRSLKRHPLQINLGWGRRIASSTRSASYSKMNGQATPRDCCQVGSLMVKQLVWRIRSRLKQYYLGRMKGNTVQYSYDAQSYAQNFDGNHHLDHPSPLAP